MNKKDLSISRGCLMELAIRIRRGELTMEEAAKNHLEFDTIFQTKVQIPKSVSTLKRLFKENNIRVFDNGRKGTTKDVSFLKYHVISIYQDLEVGITKTWMILNKKGIKCSRFSVEKAFKQYIYPPTKKSQPKKEKTRYRYLVDKVNGVWHGDIHYIIREGTTKYLFALIDDRSRYIVGYGIIEDKTALRVREVFIKTIERLNAKPLAFWSDNGKENTAKENKDFFKKENIEHILIIPGNPQSNGKIEKFWAPMDKKVKKYVTWDTLLPQIDKYIINYNDNIPHLGLEKGNDGFNKCPVDVFNDPSLKASDLNTTKIFIDSKGTMTLSEFIKLKQKSQTITPTLFSINSLLN